jgi:hypothetical protein
MNGNRKNPAVAAPCSYGATSPPLWQTENLKWQSSQVAKPIMKEHVPSY